MKAESKYETWQGKFRNLRFKFQQNYFFVTAQIVEIYIEYMYVVCEYKKKTGRISLNMTNKYYKNNKSFKNKFSKKDFFFGW